MKIKFAVFLTLVAVGYILVNTALNRGVTIKNNAIESIGDILKPANPYFLIEI